MSRAVGMRYGNGNVWVEGRTDRPALVVVLTPTEAAAFVALVRTGQRRKAAVRRIARSIAQAGEYLAPSLQRQEPWDDAPPWDRLRRRDRDALNELAPAPSSEKVSA